MTFGSDIREDDLRDISPELLHTLLKDHTLSTLETQRNIFWATHDYESRGEGYGYNDPITVERITGEAGHIIMPRVLKDRDTQRDRIRGMAEVFTPTWVCNIQNNLIDASWFDREGVFNIENKSDGKRSWEPNPDPVRFPEGKTWLDYVADTRLEITCGEAPYLASRYDPTTGEPIPLERRVGMLDRKLRVVSENTTTSKEWLAGAKLALQNVLGYEWQGDNLLIARENLLATFDDYYQAKFHRRPQTKTLNHVAYIISWNLWQMDGLKGVVPGTCHETVSEQGVLFGAERDNLPCPGCKKRDIRRHNGVYCLLRDWSVKTRTSPAAKIRFIDLLKY